MEQNELISCLDKNTRDMEERCRRLEIEHQQHVQRQTSAFKELIQVMKYTQEFMADLADSLDSEATDIATRVAHTAVVLRSRAERLEMECRLFSELWRGDIK